MKASKAGFDRGISDCLPLPRLLGPFSRAGSREAITGAHTAIWHSGEPGGAEKGTGMDLSVWDRQVPGRGMTQS